jgi:hypothetical protein
VRRRSGASAKHARGRSSPARCSLRWRTLPHGRCSWSCRYARDRPDHVPRPARRHADAARVAAQRRQRRRRPAPSRRWRGILAFVTPVGVDEFSRLDVELAESVGAVERWLHESPLPVSGDDLSHAVNRIDAQHARARRDRRPRAKPAHPSCHGRPPLPAYSGRREPHRLPGMRSS